MHRCPQTKRLSVLEHGLSVNDYFYDLINESHQFIWRLPEWFVAYRTKLIESLHSSEIIDCYTIYHDCGKPYCIHADDSGIHFPEHDKISPHIYARFNDNQAVTNLISWDMVLHTCKADQLQQYLNTWSKQDAVTLLLVGLAEIHSNAAMFGGIESTSFKIKWKHLNKRGKQICDYFFGGCK